jgi:DNA-binding MurR/RpiR family transcriptional regulator
MKLQERIAASAERLTSTDRRLLEVLLSHPTEASFLPAGEVAQRAGVHQASATKLAQRLGYRGYPDLRRSLQTELLDGASAAERVQRRLEQVADGDLVEALVRDETAALREVPRQVAQQDLDRAAELLLGARQRFVFGRGNASVLVDLLVRRLRRSGLGATALPDSGRDLAEHLVTLGAEDVLVAFAFLHPPRYLAALIQQVTAVGARLVLVTDTLAGAAEGAGGVTLSAARGSGREFQSLTVPMAVTNALVLTVARVAPERTGRSLERLDELLHHFDQ